MSSINNRLYRRYPRLRPRNKNQFRAMCGQACIAVRRLNFNSSVIHPSCTSTGSFERGSLVRYPARHGHPRRCQRRVATKINLLVQPGGYFGADGERGNVRDLSACGSSETPKAPPPRPRRAPRPQPPLRSRKRDRFVLILTPLVSKYRYAFRNRLSSRRKR